MPITNPRPCKVPGCSGTVVAWDICRKHYFRWMKYGSMDLPKQPTTEELFWQRVDKSGPIHPVLKTRCWIWTAGKFRRGYGAITIEGKVWKAHRYSYLLAHGSLNPNILVLHHCDNPSCIRPFHLFLGTTQDNTQDAVNKNRHVKGETSGVSKFTEAEIRVIRNRYIFGSSTDGTTAIGRDYGVPAITIRRIVDRITWKHVK